MKAVVSSLLLWIAGVWRISAAYNLGNSSCRHRWGRDTGSKLLGCGTTSCGFDVHSEEGVRGVKKVFYANASESAWDLKGYWRKLIYPFHFRSAVEILQQLDGECSVAPALDICDGDAGYIPYVVFAWRGTTTIKSYYIDAKRPIPGQLLLSWFDHAMKSIAPCVANRGLVVFDTFPRHALIDPSGIFIPTDEFVLMDPDGYSPSELWGRNSLYVNNTAAFVNRLFLGALLMGSILKEGSFLDSDRHVVNVIHHHVDALMVDEKIHD